MVHIIGSPRLYRQFAKEWMDAFLTTENKLIFIQDPPYEIFQPQKLKEVARRHDERKSKLQYLKDHLFVSNRSELDISFSRSSGHKLNETLCVSDDSRVFRTLLGARLTSALKEMAVNEIVYEYVCKYPNNVKFYTSRCESNEEIAG